MRTMYGKYKEYHTSLDNKGLISFKAMKECVNTYFEVIKTIDENILYKCKVQYGTPQLSKSPISFYPSKMSSNMFNPHQNELNMLLELVNLSDGENDILDIAEKKNFKLLDLVKLKDNLIRAGY